MTAAADCRIVGRWRIVEADLWDRDYLDLCGPATLVIGDDGQGEIAFGALQAGLDLGYNRSMVSFTWSGHDEMDEATGDGVAELLEDGAIEIEFSYHNGDEAILKAVRQPSSTACYGYGDGEWWYSLVPRRIFLERSLSGPDPIVTWDCTVVNGVLAGVSAVKRIGMTSHVAWLRDDLSVHDFQNPDEYAIVSPELPKDAARFRDIVLALARPFNFVRVDIYLVGDRIYLSEFTLSPGNALMGRPPDFDRHLSGLWKILE